MFLVVFYCILGSEYFQFVKLVLELGLFIVVFRILGWRILYFVVLLWVI